MQQKLFQFKEGKRKATAKVTPKIEIIGVLYTYREFLIYLQSNASGNSLQASISFVEQRLKFSHFEGSIIP